MTIKWTLKKFSVNALKDYHKNPRRLTQIQYDHLKTSIDKFGLIDKPIVTSEGLIIGGHQRKRILQKAGIKTVECWVPSRELTEKEIEELNIRHNKNTGEWDEDILANEWNATDLLQYGFSHDELGIELEESIKAEEGEEEKEEEKICPTCKQPID